MPRCAGSQSQPCTRADTPHRGRPAAQADSCRCRYPHWAWPAPPPRRGWGRRGLRPEDLWVGVVDIPPGDLPGIQADRSRADCGPAPHTGRSCRRCRCRGRSSGSCGRPCWPDSPRSPHTPACTPGTGRPGTLAGRSRRSCRPGGAGAARPARTGSAHTGRSALS